MKSNLKVRSNIYPIDCDMFQKIKKLTCNHVPVPEFMKHIRGKSALKKMIEFIHGDKANHDDIYKKWLREIGVEEWQIKLYWNLDTPCSYANGRHPHGLIGPGIIGCRCNDDRCKLYDKANNKCGV
jgi:hypothetical protein